MKGNFMPSFERLEVYKNIFDDGMVPLFFNADLDQTISITKALYEGGSHVLEFTNRGAGALKVFSELIHKSTRLFPKLIIGVGTIIDPYTAAQFIAEGANFIVGPNFEEDTARLCNKNRIPYIPGAATVTEIIKAEEFGSEIIKIFPGSSVGGPAFIKALLGPLPHCKIMPTGGVDACKENIRDWFEAGAACIGMGSKLISTQFIRQGKYKQLSTLCSDILDTIREVRANL